MKAEVFILVLALLIPVRPRAKLELPVEKPLAIKPLLENPLENPLAVSPLAMNPLENPLAKNKGPNLPLQLQLPFQNPLEVNHCQEKWHTDGYCLDIGCFTMWTYTVSNFVNI